MFYKGIVEDLDDPLELGRVRVRIIGKHTDIKDIGDDESLPTSDLPWASPVFSISSPNISGECIFAIPNKGSLVACAFFDIEEQLPFYIGTIPVISTERPDTTKGFSDPTGTYPKATYDNISPIHKNATGEDQITRGSATNSLFNQPASGYNASYPDNKVITTKSGHIIELDDSTGSERIMIYHKSGSFREYMTNGDIVDKSTGDKYTIATDINSHAENINNYASADLNETIGGNVTNEITGNLNETIDGNQTNEVGGNLSINITGPCNITSDGPALIEGTIVVVKGSSGTLQVL